MFELGEHGLFSVNRSALADQQTLGQVLLIKSFKHVFSWVERKKTRDQMVSSECNKLHSG